MGGRLRCAPLAVLLAMSLAGCSGEDSAGDLATFGAGASVETRPGTQVTASSGELELAVHGVQAHDRIAPSAYEERRPATGNTLLVLDVSVRNRGAQPRVFSEGALVAVSGDRERTFARPLDMLSDGFLSLQVLEPSAQVRGKIVYEVPWPVEGRLYWNPGGGSERLALDDLDRSSPVEAGDVQARRAEAVPAPAANADTAPPPAEPALLPASSPAAVGTTQAAKTTSAASRVWSGDGRWPPRDGPAFNCDQAWTRVEHMVCRDEDLSRMDWELNRAYALARSKVPDRAALQREEDTWRFKVRDVCPARDCVEAAYEKRIGELYWLAKD